MKKYAVPFILICADILVLIALFNVVQYIRKTLNNTHLPVFHPYELHQFLFVILIVIAIFFYEKIYTLQYDFWQESYKILKSLFLAYIIVLALLTIGKVSSEYSRLFITLYFLFALVVLPIAKRVMKRVLYGLPFFRKRVLVVGDEKQVSVMEEEFRKNWYLGLQPAQKSYDMVVIASKSLEPEGLSAVIEKYLENNAEVYVVPYVTGINFAHANILEYTNIRYNTIGIQNKLLIRRNIWIKNSFDLVAAIILLPFFVILHTVIALAIKLDSKGSVFFKQTRLGKDDKPFVCYKYRTMYENSDEILQKYLRLHPEEREYYQIYHKYQNDPRITKVGKLLRRTSLDELAQLINVLKGEMSLVGPRPYMLIESQKLGARKRLILKVKPGMTGLWQVSGRNNLTFKERKDLEVWYIKNWSLWGDLVILIKTIKVVFAKVGAQ